MTKSAAEVAASAREESMVTAEVLLRSQTFQERLEQARAAREQALSARGADDLSGSTLSKPWDRQRPAGDRRPAPVAAVPLERAAPTLFFPEEPRPAANRTAPAEMPRPAQISPPVETQAVTETAQKPARSPLLRTAIGFTLGVGLGLGIALALRPAPAPEAPNPPATTVAAPTVSVPADAFSPAAPLSAPAAGDGAPVLPVAGDAPSQRQPLTTPVAAGTETPPAAPADPVAPAPSALAVVPNLRAPAASDAAPLAPASDIPTIRTALAVTMAAPMGPDAGASYGAEATSPAHTDLAHLSIKLLSAAAPDDPALDALGERLTQAGFPAPDMGQVSYRVRETHVRFYHGEDAAAARDLAQLIGAEARDFTGADTPPPAGLIELWVAPSGAAVPPAPKTDAAPKAAKPKTAGAKADAKTAKAAAKKKADAARAEAQAQAQAAEAAEAARVKARILLLLQSGKNP